MSAWTVVYLAEPVELEDGDVLTLAFTSESDANRFKERTSPADSVSEHVRNAIQHHLGVRVKFKVRLGGAPRPAPSAASAPAPSESAPPADPDPAPVAAAPTPVTGWNVVAIPGATATSVADEPAGTDEPPALDDADAPPADDEPADDLPSPPPPPIHPAEAAGRQRYGESVVREVLGARFIGEETIEPAVSLTPPPREDE
jgi:DNA polymerase-3 subunit gamma/tau